MSEGRLSALARKVRLNDEGSFNYFGDCISGDPAYPAVVGLEPIAEPLSAFARIACGAASSNVFTSDDTGVVYDVLPCRDRPSAVSRGPELNPTINTVRIAILDLLF
jgi:hypothetical protein